MHAQVSDQIKQTSFLFHSRPSSNVMPLIIPHIKQTVPYFYTQANQSSNLLCGACDNGIIVVHSLVTHFSEILMSRKVVKHSSREQNNIYLELQDNIDKNGDKYNRQQQYNLYFLFSLLSPYLGQVKINFLSTGSLFIYKSHRHG